MRILLAEDEEDLADVIQAMLQANDFTVDLAENGAEALRLAKENAYDGIVTDIMMPVMDGVTAVKEMRKTGDMTPVLMLTAKTEVEDRITGLDAGADDYLTKPFSMGELLARVRALTRRGREYAPRVIKVYNVTLNLEKEELSCMNSISLAAKEIKLMEFFMNNPEKEFTTEELLNKFWRNDDSTDPEAVWMYISFLRNKLKSVGAKATIVGEHGGSYMMTGEK